MVIEMRVSHVDDVMRLLPARLGSVHQVRFLYLRSHI